MRAFIDVRNWPLVLLLLVGLTCLDVWPDLVGHGTAFLASAESLQTVTNGRVLFSLGMCLSTALHAVFPRRLGALDVLTLPVVTIVSAAATVGYALFGTLAPSGGMLAVGFALAFLIGFGYGWYLVRILCQLAQSGGMGTVVLLAATSRLLKTGLDLHLGLLGTSAQVCVTAAMPLLTGLAVAFSQRVPTSRGVPLDLAELSKCEGDDERVLFCILVMNAVLHATTRSMSTLGFWGNGYVIAGTVGAPFVASCVMLLALTHYTMADDANTNMLTRFLPAFLTLLAGLLALNPNAQVALNMSAQIVDVLTTTVELYAHVLYWVVIVTAIRRLRSHPYRLAGLPVAVMDLTAALLALFFQQTAGIEEASHMNSVVITVAMYVFTAFVVVLFKGSRDRDSMTLEAADDETSRVAGTVAASHRLSPRETEVFLLLAQGRDRAFIKNELFISDATIKTHTQRIYAKLGVHC